MSLNRLTKRFGEHRGIEDINLQICPGEVFGFLGPNGAGKSTTIRLAVGLTHPTAGSVRALGMDPVRDGARLRRDVGYLPGELALFARLTGKETLERFCRARGLTDTTYRDQLVERFGAELDRPVRMLSKGNRQKLGLVLAFMHRPRLLVLDEPTSGLDPLLQEEFTRLLAESAAAGATVFLSSHDLDEVQRAVQRLAIIRDGTMVTVDSVEGLRARAPRTVELRFANPQDAYGLDHIPGVSLVQVDPGRVTLKVTGPLGPLLKEAARRDVQDMTATPSDLDELFRTFYADGRDDQGADVH
ncbi:ABC transporter ATP-binding protein [Pedococcus sp.]|uniref:ABC transporter ATP-binding protein n=1 Tax=Pedococcus sp. TaxID=2860345 RepID=UPI002E0E6270